MSTYYIYSRTGRFWYAVPSSIAALALSIGYTVMLADETPEVLA